MNLEPFTPLANNKQALSLFSNLVQQRYVEVTAITHTYRDSK